VGKNVFAPISERQKSAALLISSILGLYREFPLSLRHEFRTLSRYQKPCYMIDIETFCQNELQFGASKVHNSSLRVCCKYHICMVLMRILGSYEL
jgi:hypothetical protein